LIWTDNRNVEFSRIKAISGATAQHSIILLTSEFTKTISASNLDAKRPLHEQFDAEKVLSTPFATNWQDSTTGQQCREMEQDVHAAHGQDGESSAMTMAKITGSSAHERFSGPQAKKIFQKLDTTWKRTEHVCLLSSFLTTLLCADGRVRGPDEADASGMNLWDLSETSGRRWNKALLKSVVGGNEAEAERLQHMLGEVEQDPRVSAGTVGDWFKKRYGFPEGTWNLLQRGPPVC
jgi:xylulokinase